MQEGPIPADPELRWIAEIRNLVRRATMDLITEELVIQETDDKAGLFAYFRLLYQPSKEEMKTIRSAIRNFARSATKIYRLHAVELGNDCICLHIYRKPQKKRKVR